LILQLHTNHFFPYTSTKKQTKKHTVTIGIGGNIGDVKLRFKKLFLYFLCDKRVDVLATSPMLENPAFGYLEQDDFINGVVVLSTNMSVGEFLRYILHVEKFFGRKRSFKNAPRTLDIDIIFFDDLKVDKKNLKIPHPHWMKRDSVIIPLIHINRKCL
jgi:2-amino-4-hydroxy-6-hydroxymethyldihydropteridine diphosphokinase